VESRVYLSHGVTCDMVGSDKGCGSCRRPGAED
jgi:hypothetical protein